MENSFPSALVDRINQKKVAGVTAEHIRIGGVKMAEPSGYRVIAKFWQIEAWTPAVPLTGGWHIERLAGKLQPDWRACLPDIDSIAAILNDHHWHGDESYRYRVEPPDSATDDELSHIEDIGGIL